MRTTKAHLGSVLVLALACMHAGCSRKAGGAASAAACDDWGDDDSLTCDDLQYEALQQQLDRSRSSFVQADAAGLQIAGTQVYWLDFTNPDPTLHRADASMQSAVDYAFDVGGADAYNFRASPTLVVTAEAGTGVVHAYDAAQADAEIARATFPSPATIDADSWPYAVDGDVVYVVVEPQSGTDDLYRWEPRQGGQPVRVTTLQSAGVAITELESLSVSGDTALVVDGNGLWALDLQANRAKPVMGQTAIGSAVDVESDGITFTFTDPNDEDALGFWDAASGTLRDLSDEIAQSSYSIDPTYADAHEWNSEGFARWGRWIVYGADLGVFAYDLDTRVVEPVLLEPATIDTTLDYRNPVTLPDGTMLVTGLTSTPSVIEQGPVFEVHLASVLH